MPALAVTTPGERELVNFINRCFMTDSEKVPDALFRDACLSGACNGPSAQELSSDQGRLLR